MKVQLETEGGVAYFPGLAQPVVIDTDTLPPKEAAELQRLVGAARLSDRPERAAPPARGAADHRTYTLTIDDGGRQHTVSFTDPVSDPELQALVSFLRSQGR
jgi:hypothetical protein